MVITIAVVSILVVTALVWLANRMLPFTVCPICAGVFLTWMWLLGAVFLGYGIDPAVPALLMGGSVIGITSLLEKRFRGSADALLIWKILFIPAGFVAAYGALGRSWMLVLTGGVALLLATLLYLFLRGGSETRDDAVRDIEKKMKNCC